MMAARADMSIVILNLQMNGMKVSSYFSSLNNFAPSTGTSWTSQGIFRSSVLVVVHIFWFQLLGFPSWVDDSVLILFSKNMSCLL